MYLWRACNKPCIFFATFFWLILNNVPLESLQQALYYQFASKCVVEIVYADNGLQSSKENMRWAQLPEKIAKGECSFPKGIRSLLEK